MYEPLKVMSWASAHERCLMRCSISGSDNVAFIFGSGGDTFEFSFDAGALRNLLKLGADALQEMEAQAVQEKTDNAAVPTAINAATPELATAGERSE